MKLFILAMLIAVTGLAQTKFAPKPTEYEGTVVACGPKGIVVQGKIGTRLFPIYSGTVFGKGRSQKLSDFKPGTYVKVVFSELVGKVQAENIRTSTPPKKK